MTRLFSALLSVSAAAALLIAAVILLRLALRRAPRSLLCLLWIPVALRLLLPIPLRSGLSLIPASVSRESVAAWTETRLYSLPAGSNLNELPPAADPAPSAGETKTDADPAPANTPAARRAAPERMTVLSGIWAFGAGAMLLYALISTLRLRRQVRTSAPAEKGVRICDGLRSPFILGLFRPCIYLPSSLDPGDCGLVMAHERTHLRRLDHVWKPLGFLLLSLWWFHPLVWAAYILFCRDIELACDEAVVRTLDGPGKRAYAETLLRCSAPRREAAACPLAFGETGVKARVRAIMNYKKPAFWIILAAAAAVIVLAVCFLTEPKGKNEPAPDPASAQGAASAGEPFEALLQGLAADFDAAGQEPTFENLTAFLKTRPDFAALSADNAAVAALLRQGFTLGGTRERVIAHYALSRAAVEEDPAKYPDLIAGLDAADSLTEEQYAALLADAAVCEEPRLTRLTGQGIVDWRRDVADPALRVLFVVYPGFPAETGTEIRSCVRADGEALDLYCTTEILNYSDSGMLRVTFRLSDRHRSGFWSYEVTDGGVHPDGWRPTSGELVTADPGDGYCDVLETIWNGGLATLAVDRAVFGETAEKYASLPFDPFIISSLGQTRKNVIETLDMTDETWEYLTLENGQEGMRPYRRTPVTVDGADWTFYLRFAPELDVNPYLWEGWYQLNVKDMSDPERYEVIERVYRQLCGYLGDPDLPYGKQSFNYTPIETGLEAGGFSANAYNAVWILRDGMEVPGWGETVVLCILSYQTQLDPEGPTVKVEYRLNSAGGSGLARYEQLALVGSRSHTLADLVGLSEEEQAENEVFEDFSAPFLDRFGTEIHEFAREYHSPGYGWISNCYEAYPFEKADAMTVNGVRYDVHIWADGRYGAIMDQPLCHADYTPAAGETVTAESVAALAAELTARYGEPLIPAHTRKGSAAEGLQSGADGLYMSVWLIDDSPDYPELPEDYYPAGLRPWSYNVTAASLALTIRDGKITYTLSFDVKSLRALPVDWESFDPRA